MRKERRELLLYFVAVLTLSTSFAVALVRLKVTDDWAWGAVAFIPGLAAAAFRALGGQGFSSVGWRLGPARYWLWACLVPLLMLGSSIALSLLLGYRSVGSLPASVHGSVMNLLLKMALTTVIAMPFAFGEEFAWRGYAQDKLIRQFGLLRGLFLLGLLWGLWHSPLYYLMDIFPNHPLLGPFVMTPIDNILVVVPFAWFYIRSKSIWVPTFVHALGDILWGYSDKLFPIHSEIGAWAMLQGVQLVLSIFLLRALMTGRRHAKPLLVGDTPNQSMKQSGSAQRPAVAYLFRDF